MTDHPIIFSAPVIQALLDGRKTMTRRLAWRKCTCPSPWQKVKPGDRLYVRENWCHTGTGVWTINDARYGARDGHVIYAADGAPGVKWWPSIHMPREFSRLTLEVTATKIEKLTAITEEDAAAEGCEDGKLDDGFGPIEMGGGYTIESSGTWASAAGKFQILWNSLHGENAWEEADYAETEVVALSFTVHKRNIDSPTRPQEGGSR